MYKNLLTITLFAILLSACNNDNDDNNNIDTKTASLLTQGSFVMNKSLGEVIFTKGDINSAPLALNVGFGSGAYHRKGDHENIFYTISDRGPNIGCKSSESIIGIDEFCPENGNKIFPQPEFTPTIYKVMINKNSNDDLGYEIVETIPLKKSNGELITGVTNQLTVTDTETSVAANGQLLNYDNSGLDTEALVRLQDGSFWVTDEYGPSLVHVASDGTILQRVVPESVAADLKNAGYPVVGLLPDNLKHRKLNRGIESIALASDESALYFIMQSPLAFPDKAAYSQSRHVRLFKMALESGKLGTVLGEYVYHLDAPSTFSDTQGNGDIGKKQSDVKISEMVEVGDDQLVILERISKTSKFYRIDLNTGSNIHKQAISTGRVANNESTVDKTLEQVYDLASHDAHPVAKTLVFNTLTDMPSGMTAPSKLEGIALLNDQYVLLINDNDFAIKNAPTKALVIAIADKFSSDKTALQKPKMSLIARYQSGLLDESAAEIVAFHKNSQHIYVVNAQSKQVDVLSGLQNITPLSNPLTQSNLKKVFSIDTVKDYAQSGGVNSVAIDANLLAVAVENNNKQAPGIVAFYQLNKMTGEATYLKNVPVGALPDNVQFSPDGTKLIVAGEGEPSQDYQIDPEGSIAIIDINNGIPATQANILGFTAFNKGAARAEELPAKVRIYGGAFSAPPSTVAQDLEPEYVSFSDDSKWAYISLQENNAIAVVDLITRQISKIIGLGYKDYSQAENALDVSDKDIEATSLGTVLRNGKARVNIKAWDNIVGMYQPDTIASYSVNGVNYIVTANEGDAREYISGEVVDSYTDKATCETHNLNWDSKVKACFDGDTPTLCASKGLLNQENEVCFSYLEEFRVESLLDEGGYSDYVAPIPNSIAAIANRFSDEIKVNANDQALGRLKISTVNAINGTSQHITRLQSYGARSFSIWTEDGLQVYDSGSDIARITASRVGEFFNASNDRAADHKKNDRSSAKGAEPEALAIGVVNGKTYAFVGLERVGGIMVYDITNPYGVQFIEYITNRDFSQDPTQSTQAGDVGPEGMKFVAAKDSPTNNALLIVGNEVSGTTSVYQIE